MTDGRRARINHARHNYKMSTEQRTKSMDQDRVRYSVHYYCDESGRYEIHPRFPHEYFDAMRLAIRMVNYGLWHKAIVYSNESGLPSPVTEVHRDNAVHLISAQRCVERYEAEQNARYPTNRTAAQIAKKILEVTDKSCVACVGEPDMRIKEVY